MKREHLCKCGCGHPAKKCYDKTGRFKQYARYAEGHVPRYPITEKRLAAFERKKGMGNPRALPIGSKRICDAGNGVSYYQVKVHESGSWVFEHRYVMEQHLGRKLKKDEIVHHLNCNTLDNQFENLALLSHAEHMRIHHAGKPLDYSRKLPDGKWSEQFDKCIECGTTSVPYRGRGLCRNCYERARRRSFA